MKNKNKKLCFLFSLLLLAGFFGFAENTSAAENTIIINEVMIGSSDDSRKEFIELYNNTSEIIDLSGFALKKKATEASSLETNLISSSKFTGNILPNHYFLITTPEYKNFFNADISYSGADYSIAKNNVILLYDKNERLVTSLGYGDENKDHSYNFEDEKWLWSSILTPREENEFDPIIEEETKCSNFSDSIKITEIFPYPESGDEFIELVNNGEDCVDISDWKIMDGAGHKADFPESSILFPDEYFKLEQNLYLNNDSDIVYLLDSNGTTKEDAIANVFYEKAKKNYSWSFDGENWIWTSIATPGQENEFDEPEEEIEEENMDQEETYDYKIRLNEILPNPEGDEKTSEYIEIYNGEDFEINLEGWKLKDLSKTNFTFSKNYSIKPGKYLTIYRNIFKFGLNNSGEEKVFLLDPDGNITSSLSYEDSKENISYSFGGSFWKWSKFLTPGKENKFNSPPEIKLKKIKEGYVGMPVNFEVETKKKSKKLKFSWNFGDKKKSYIQNPAHTYQKKGSYDVTLSIDDGVEETLKSFAIKIKNYPKLDLEITKLLPNPYGKDTGKEWIEIKNNSKKKVDLKSWKIATGSKESLISHTILTDFEIKPGKVRQLTRKNAFFSLNNKEMKLELRSPNGKMVDKVSYRKSKIVDDEVYAKINDKWIWIAPQKESEFSEPKEETETEENEEIPPSSKTPEEIQPENITIDVNPSEITTNVGRYSPLEEWEHKKKAKLSILNIGLGIKTVSAFSEESPSKDYFSSNTFPSRKHWAVNLFENAVTNINSLFNKFISIL